MSGIPTIIICVVDGAPPNTYEHILLEETVRISNGAFGVVYSSKLYKRKVQHPIIYTPSKDSSNSYIPSTSEVVMNENNKPLTKLEFRACCTDFDCVAIKKVHQDERYKNRELQILRNLNHPNIIKLKYFFRMEEKDGNHLCLIFDYFPLTLAQFYRDQHRQNGCNPDQIKAIMLQICRGLQYIHATDICHRDIKPQNLLYNPEKGLTQIADFGSAKQLVVGQKSVSYICSRHYRAPELIFGLTTYTCSIDVWATGCVMAEMIIGRPIFPGDSNVGQLSEIIRIIGNPTNNDLVDMNPEYQSSSGLHVNPITLHNIIPQPKWKSAVDFLNNLLVYSPFKRITSDQMVQHPYFSNVIEKAAFGTLSLIH